ncbi:unnamed protein product [Ceutorhynchus assimilis]|uniref:Immediate early response gene 5-like protein n=1 Tax=Ceutorhynchus assimilis TaxID=467358 RepID=A0A9N9MVS4_9CUCU|nr:unnamed protein product [Ceutorhynchus assimilis]
MASEAQRLIGISLTKIAQSRSHRGGVSLHKNLLVATVLQKARYIFMEEAYNMVHYHPVQQQQRTPELPEEDLVGLTAEEAGLEASNTDSQDASCVCQDKENLPPQQELTYLDLDKSSSNKNSLKRRRAVAEWETEEAVQSILPKKLRQDSETSSSDDSVFLDDATLLSDIVSKEVEAEQRSSGAMEIDRITSLVSIFSFSMAGEAAKINRSATPDLCSTQAKDTPDSIQQRPFLAMTV